LSPWGRELEEKTHSRTVRAFIAAEISEEVRAGLGELLTRLKRTEAGVSWSRPGSIHLTLRFLGNILEDQIEAADAAMAPKGLWSPQASLLAELSQERLGRRETDPIEVLVPIYVPYSDAELGMGGKI